jgi:regulator of RNase E activity RraA
MQPWGVNEVITCGGIVVRPGDAIIGDDDGVVVVPAAMAEEVLKVSAEREAVEHVIKAELKRNPGSPGKYYPFNDDTWKLYEEYKQRGEA